MPKSLAPVPQEAEIPPGTLTRACQHLHLLCLALGEGHMAQQGLDVIAGLSQPIALHIPAEGGGSHPAGIVFPPTCFLGDNFSTTHLGPQTADAAQGPPQFSCSSPEMLLLVQGIQEVVGHDVLPHQVVTDASWKRGSSPNSPQPCSGQALATPPATHVPPVGTQVAHGSLEGYEQQTPTPASGTRRLKAASGESHGPHHPPHHTVPASCQSPHPPASEAAHQECPPGTSGASHRPGREEAGLLGHLAQ